MEIPNQSKIDSIPSNFDLWEKFPKSDVAINGVYEEIYPQSNITGEGNTNSLTFHIHGTDKFIDFPNSYIIITGEIYGSSKAGAAAAAPFVPGTTKVSPTNNFAHNLFSRMTVKLNNTTISTTDNYPYVSYLNTKLNHDTATLNDYFKIQGYVPDDVTVAGLNNTNPDSAAFKALKNRASLCGTDEKTYQFLFYPFTSIFSMDKVLIPHVDVELSFDRSVSSEFYFMHPVAAQTVYNYGFNITNAVFLVRLMDAKPDYNVGIETTLTNTLPMNYFIRNPQIITQNISANSTFHNQSDFLHGYVPEKIYIMFVKTAAFKGQGNLNPFCFENCGINKICLYKNGIPHPYPPITANFAEKQYIQLYHMTLKSLQAPSPGTPSISYEEFRDGCTIFCYDLSPDLSGGIDPHSATHKRAALRLNVQFETATTAEVMCLIYYEQDTLVTIDYARSVQAITDF